MLQKGQNNFGAFEKEKRSLEQQINKLKEVKENEVSQLQARIASL